MDLLLQKDRNKLGFGDVVFVNGACPVTEDFAESTAQRVFVLLRTFQNEWYLNTTTGIPYLQSILGYKVTTGTVDRLLQEKILQEEGVASIEQFSSSMGGNRVYEASMVIRTTQGTTFTDTVNVQ